MNNSWIKLYRKLTDNDVMTDPVACTLFLHILLKVDRETGTYTTGRIYLSAALKLPQSTVRDALSRLSRSHKLISTSTTTKCTTIRVLNWDKYQHNTVSDDNQTTARRQPTDTKQEERIENNSFTNVKEETPEKPVVERTPEPPKPLPVKVHPYSEIIRYCREKQGIIQNYPQYGKQTKAVKSALDDGYTMDDLRFVIDEMAAEEFWRAHPFDLMSVYNNMYKYKNRVIMFKKGDLKRGKYAYN